MCSVAVSTCTARASNTSHFYIVLSGAVQLYYTSARGDERTLRECGEGDSFGEYAFIVSERPHVSAARARCDGALLLLPPRLYATDYAGVAEAPTAREVEALGSLRAIAALHHASKAALA